MDVKSIIVRMPNWLGDVVMATATLADIRAHFPEAKITAMVLRSLAPLLEGNPHIDEIFSFERPNSFLRREESRDLIERLRQGRYDLGILLTNSFSSAFSFWRGRVKKRIGYACDGRSFFLSQAVAFPKERGKEHLVLTYKRLLIPLGIPLSERGPELFVTDEEKGRAREILRQRHVPEGAKLIGINPLAAFGPAKCWLPERFRETAIRLLQEQKDLYVLFFGDRAGAALVREICCDLPPRVINLAGLTTLRELAAFISILDLFLTNDSGPMHIAAALKTPLVALFGSTDLKVTGPFGEAQVIQKPAKCSPCFLPKCPVDFSCMKRIEVDEVVAGVMELLRKEKN